MHYLARKGEVQCLGLAKTLHKPQLKWKTSNAFLYLGSTVQVVE